MDGPARWALCPAFLPPQFPTTWTLSIESVSWLAPTQIHTHAQSTKVPCSTPGHRPAPLFLPPLLSPAGPGSQPLKQPREWQIQSSRRALGLPHQPAKLPSHSGPGALSYSQSRPFSDRSRLISQLPRHPPPPGGAGQPGEYRVATAPRMMQPPTSLTHVHPMARLRQEGS